MNQAQRKKAEERRYLDGFLVGAGLTPRIQEIRASESPDFILSLIDRTEFGVEVRQLFGGESSGAGSLERKREAMGQAWLRQLCDCYYASGGTSAHVNLRTQLLLDESSARRVAAWLVAEVAGLTPMATDPADFEMIEGGALVATGWISRLPIDYPPYRRWRLLDHAIGWRRDASAELLQGAIDEKAGLLPAYRREVQKVALLLVADASFTSGMFHRECPAVDGRGFDSVQLLFAPGTEVVQLSPPL